jgi:hypothetical protein
VSGTRSRALGHFQRRTATRQWDRFVSTALVGETFRPATHQRDPLGELSVAADDHVRAPDYTLTGTHRVTRPLAPWLMP